MLLKQLSGKDIVTTEHPDLENKNQEYFQKVLTVNQKEVMVLKKKIKVREASCAVAEIVDKMNHTLSQKTQRRIE